MNDIQDSPFLSKIRIGWDYVSSISQTNYIYVNIASVLEVRGYSGRYLSLHGGQLL
jgi:hypothetical protein